MKLVSVYDSLTKKYSNPIGFETMEAAAAYLGRSVKNDGNLSVNELCLVAEMDNFTGIVTPVPVERFPWTPDVFMPVHNLDNDEK